MTAGAMRGEDGAGVVLTTMLLGLAAVMVAAVVVAAGDVARVRGVAQDAADAAALAAAHRARDGPTAATAAAHEAAAAAGATLVRCRCTGATVSATVRATVVAAAPRRLGLTYVEASATARLVPRATGTGAAGLTVWAAHERPVGRTLAARPVGPRSIAAVGRVAGLTPDGAAGSRHRTARPGGRR